MGEGDRIIFTTADLENRVRSSDFATLERIGDDNSIAARLDSGRTVELDSEKARHIDYGYTVESAQHLNADRILLTGESSQLAEQQAALTKLNPHTREIGIYTSDDTNLLQEGKGTATDAQVAEEGLSVETAPSNVPESTIPKLILRDSDNKPHNRAPRSTGSRRMKYSPTLTAAISVPLVLRPTDRAANLKAAPPEAVEYSGEVWVQPPQNAT